MHDDDNVIRVRCSDDVPLKKFEQNVLVYLSDMLVTGVLL